MSTIVYIQGYGRSGSTLLDTLLHQHKQAYSIGALNNIFLWFAKKEVCACGEYLGSCSFWGKVTKSLDLDKHANSYQKIQSSVEKLSNFNKLLDGNSRHIENYKKLQTDVFSDVFAISKKPVVIDSSKSTRDCTGRAYALYNYTDFDVKIIHLVRDVRGVCWSTIKKTGSSERKRFTNNKFINSVRAAFSWWLTNHLALKTVKALPNGAVLTLRYEDLCYAPVEQMQRIGEFLGLDYNNVGEKITSGDELEVSHNLGGNQIRFSRSLKFKPDLEWKTKMPTMYRLVTMLIAGRLNKKFGY